MLAIVALAASPARAQAPLAGLLPELILREITLPRPAAGFSHDVHFSPLTISDLENPAVGIVQTFNKLMALQFSTFPLGSSTGGFTYTFDPTLGTFRRASGSFGPSFAERAITIGRKKLSVGLNYQRTRYNTFEGADLDDGSIKFYLRHFECCATTGPPVPPTFGIAEVPNGTRLDPFFEGDVIEAALSLEATTNAAVFFANYGLTDRWDVGVAVPLVHVDIEASVLARIVRLSTAAVPQIHSFELGNPAATERAFSRSGSASGIGDVVLRSKYNLFSRGATALAAAVDLRLPTGDENNLLGAGGTQWKPFLVASSSQGRFGQHLNIGYTFVDGELGGGLSGGLTTAAAALPDELNYTAGIEFTATPRLTLIADIVGRTLRDSGRLRIETKTFQYQQQVPVQPVPIATFQEFEPQSGSLRLLLGTAGAKFNPIGDLLISGSVLFPLTDAGLKSRLTTVVGIDYAF